MKLGTLTRPVEDYLSGRIVTFDLLIFLNIIEKLQ